MIRLAVVIVLALCAHAAAADGETEADRAFRTALAAGDIDALETLGRARPVTRWTDDAWLEAARLAVRANDYARARRDLDESIATGTDPALVRRARTERARLATLTGDTGEWTAVASSHERLVTALGRDGDPRATLNALAQLVDSHPAYPRRVIVMLAIAAGWEREGHADRAVHWLRRARDSATEPLDRLRAHADLVRTLVRDRELTAASEELERLASTAPPALVIELRASLDRAYMRRVVRRVLWALLAALAAVAAWSARRHAGTWRAAARAIVRPPTEVLFLAPVAAVLVALAYTGNPLVARAVRAIAIAGVVVSWLSGAILRAGPRHRRRAITHALLAIVAVASVAYLAVDRGHLIDFVRETWRAGHERG